MLRITNYPSTLYATPTGSDTTAAPSVPSMRAIADEFGSHIVAEVAKTLELANFDVGAPLPSDVAEKMLVLCEDYRAAFSGVNTACILCLSATNNTKDFQAVAQLAGLDTKGLTSDARASIDRAFSEKLDSASNGNRGYVDLREAREILKHILTDWKAGHRAYLPVDRRV